MEKLVGIVTKRPSTRVRRDDDFVDRLNHRYTVVVIVIFAVVVTTYMFGGKPITCWAPKHFTGSHIKFANSYCWVKNTYYLPYQEEIPRVGEEHLKKEIPYYQWIPFVLLAQAILFFFPSAVWHGLNQKAGVDSDHILEIAGMFQNVKKTDAREKFLEHITHQMDTFLWGSEQRRARTIGCKDCISATLCRCCRGGGMGCYLVVLYLVTKILYMGNIVGQLFLLNVVLNTDFAGYGSLIFSDLVHDTNVYHTAGNTAAFPKVTMCDFNIRRLGNVHRYTLQCVLPINMFNEKVYAVLWFWMLFVLLVTTISFITWFTRAVFPNDRVRYIRNHLVRANRITENDDSRLPKDFTNKYLKQDGVFLLRLIGHNTNRLTVSDITGHLWDLWKDKKNRAHVQRDRKQKLQEGESGDTMEKKPLTDTEHAEVIDEKPKDK